MIRNKYFLLGFRLTAGGVFIWAGLLKILDPLGFAQDIANYRMFPQGVSFFLALILPWIEVLCGVFLIFGILRQASAFLLSLLLVSFLLLIASAIMRGIDIDCGCFGRLSHKVDFTLIVVDGILLFFTLNVFLQKKAGTRTAKESP
ncbi:MAG: MauE/DoxX family redox-associated membrane protein [Candidatus Aminicenantales bacterium]